MDLNELNCSFVLGRSHMQFVKQFLHVDNISRVLYIVCALFDFCNFSQCPAGGGRVRYQEKGKASAELSEILPRLQAAQGVGAPHPRVTAPTGRRLPGTSCGKSAHNSTYTCGGTGTLCRALCVVNHGIVLKTVFFCYSTCYQKWAPGTLTFSSSIVLQMVR